MIKQQFKIFLSLTLISFIVMSTIADGQEELYIYRGIDAQLGEFAWHVAIGSSDESYSRYSGYLCGGTILSPKWVITAAHCVANQKKSDLIVSVGLIDLYDDSIESFKVEGIFLHPNFRRDEDLRGTDLALLLLKRDVNFSHLNKDSSDKTKGDKTKDIKVNAIDELASDPEPSRGDTFSIPGWGNTSNLIPPTRSRNLKYLEKIDYISRAECNRLDFYGGNVPSGVICAGRNSENEDTCPYDSGGGLVQRGASKSRLVGVYLGGWRGGAGCGLTKKPGIYASIGASYAWIKGCMASCK